MRNINLQFPPGFENYAWEVEAKGWLSGVVAVIDERRYTINVYDPTRLAQTVEDAIEAGNFFLEPNLVVVAAVTRENIVSAIQELLRTGRMGDLQPDRTGWP